MSFNPELQTGDIINNSELMEIFKCSNSGGMRRSHETGTLVIVSDHTKAIYEDRWKNKIFHYTGMGLTGDQSINNNQNRTLNMSNTNGVDVFLFEVFNPGEYFFMGQVVLADAPYQEDQPDIQENMRKVWVFPLKLKDGKEVVLPAKPISDKQERKNRQARKLSNTELEKRARNSSRDAGSRTITTNTYERNPYVTEYAKRRAAGKCQLCDEMAPFKDKKGNYYLETHHIEWLSKGGDDSIENTVALCPNCHRKMHVLDLAEDKAKLRSRAAISN